MYLFTFCVLLHLSSDNASTITSLTHAMLVSYISITVLPDIMHLEFSDSHWAGHTSALLTIQYMMYDIMNIKHKEFYLHHFMAIIASLYTLYTNTYQVLVLFIELNEISTIFLNLITWNISFAKPMFALTFFVCRIILLIWIIFWEGVPSVFLTLLLQLHFLINMFWFVKIIRRIRRD